MSGILRFSKANPVRMVITSWQSIINNDINYQFFRDYSKPHHDSYFQPFLTSDTLIIQFDSSFDATNVVTLKNYYTGATISTTAATEVVDNTTYQVYQNTISLSGLDGVYYVEVTGTDADTETYTAISEPIYVAATQCNTILMSYYNNEVAFGIDYRTGFTFQLRLDCFFNKLDNDIEIESFTDSGGERTMINSEITQARVLKATKLLPQWMIEKINIALSHDYCDIEGVQVVADRQLPYDVIGDRILWGEPEATLSLAEGSANFRNLHDSGARESL